jgi:hypothetical protein
MNRDGVNREPDDVLAALRELYTAIDPAPDMVDRVLFALDIDRIDIDRIDIELAAIIEELSGVKGARTVQAGIERTRTITFESSSLRITISVPSEENRYLDGWIEPPGELGIELVTPDARFETRSDEGGRFAFESVPNGQMHLEILPTEGSAVNLARRVVTQGVVL